MNYEKFMKELNKRDDGKKYFIAVDDVECTQGPVSNMTIQRYCENVSIRALDNVDNDVIDVIDAIDDIDDIIDIENLQECEEISKRRTFESKFVNNKYLALLNCLRNQLRIFNDEKVAKQTCGTRKTRCLQYNEDIIRQVITNCKQVSADTFVYDEYLTINTFKLAKPNQIKLWKSKAIVTLSYVNSDGNELPEKVGQFELIRVHHEISVYETVSAKFEKLN